MAQHGFESRAYGHQSIFPPFADAQRLGREQIGEKEYEESIEEMNHADTIIERILFLGGLPNLQDLGKLYIGENVEEILQCDMKLEDIAVPMYRDAVAHCEKVRDYGTRDILQAILIEEENHVDFLETQFDLIKQMGIQNYIQLQSGSAEGGEG